MDDPDEMFQLADLLEGVSVDCTELSIDAHPSGMNHLILKFGILLSTLLFVLTTTREKCCILKFFVLLAKIDLLNPVDSAESSSSPPNSDEYLVNKDLLNQVCHLLSLAFFFLTCFGLLCIFLTFYLYLLSLFKMLNSRAHMYVNRHSHSLDDVRLFPAPAPLGKTLPPDSSHSYTFGLPHISTNPKTPVDHSYYPLLHSQAKPSFYGRRSTNSLSLDMLGDEHFLEFIF